MEENHVPDIAGMISQILRKQGVLTVGITKSKGQRHHVAWRAAISPIDSKLFDFVVDYDADPAVALAKAAKKWDLQKKSKKQ